MRMIVNYIIFIFFKILRKIKFDFSRIFFRLSDFCFFLLRLSKYIFRQIIFLFLKKKKLLIIGDLSLSPSYGGVLTTYGLFNFIQKLKNINNYLVERIPFRSFNLHSPTFGFNDLSYKELFFYKKKEFPYFFNSKINNLPKNFSNFSKVYNQILDKKFYNDEFRKIKSADIILINAEGALVNNFENPNGIKKSTLYYLFLLYFLNKFLRKKNKKIIILNHCFFPPKKIEDKFITLYAGLDEIIVRDKLSLKKIKAKNKNLNPIYFPDFIFHNNARNSFSPKYKYKKFFKDNLNNYAIISDSAHLNRENVNLDFNNFYNNLIKILKKKKINVVFLNGNNPSLQDFIFDFVKKHNLIELRMNNTCPNDLIKVIQNCKFIISGRWHFSLLAFKFNKPLMLFDTDSPKTKVLCKDLYRDYQFYLNSKDLSSSYLKIKKKINFFLKNNKLIEKRFRKKNVQHNKNMLEQIKYFNDLI